MAGYLVLASWIVAVARGLLLRPRELNPTVCGAGGNNSSVTVGGKMTGGTPPLKVACPPPVGLLVKAAVIMAFWLIARDCAIIMWLYNAWLD
jgi:hypothetical protein